MKVEGMKYFPCNGNVLLHFKDPPPPPPERMLILNELLLNEQ